MKLSLVQLLSDCASHLPILADLLTICRSERASFPILDRLAREPETANGKRT